MLSLGGGGGGGGERRVSVGSGICSTYVWFCLYLFCFSFINCLLVLNWTVLYVCISQ